MWQVGISKLCTGEPESVAWELPGKGPVAKVYATFTFRPTEGLSDAASDIERDSFGFEIAQLQRDTYRVHKDVLRKISKDDRQRIEELLETGLLVDRQQVCELPSRPASYRVFVFASDLALCSATGVEARRDQRRAAGSSRRSVAGVQPAQGPPAARARVLQVSDCPHDTRHPLHLQPCLLPLL